MGVPTRQRTAVHRITSIVTRAEMIPIVAGGMAIVTGTVTAMGDLTAGAATAEAEATEPVATVVFRGTIAGKSSTNWIIRFEKERCFMASTKLVEIVAIGVTGILLSNELQ